MESSSGSNVVPRRARPGLAGLRPHIVFTATGRALSRRPERLRALNRTKVPKLNTAATEARRDILSQSRVERVQHANAQKRLAQVARTPLEPLWSEDGKYKAGKARFWPWLSG